MSNWLTEQKLINNLFFEKNFEELSGYFFQKIQYFKNFQEPFEKIYKELNDFLSSFLEIFISKDFVIPSNHFKSYLTFNPFISELVYISKIETTDSYILILLDGNTKNLKFESMNQFIKVLSLYSLRNEISLNYEDFLYFNRDLSSSWYWIYFNTTDFSGENNFRNIKRHIDYIEKINHILNCDKDILQASFASTYGNPDKDILIKKKMNNYIQNKYQNIKFDLKPEPNKIAIVSGLLSPVHSVYRGTYSFIESLAGEYELTLIHLGEWRDDIDTGIFNKVVQLKLINNYFDLSKISNNFVLAYYPDISFTKESSFLSNIRIAPVQVAGHGHSVGNYGSKIDYFISGTLSEVQNKSEEFYSERLVLIPGIGLHPTYPDYEIQNFRNESGKFIILCPWSIQKINYDHLINLKEIIQKSQKEILFRFFPGILNYCMLEAFTKQINSILGKDNVQIVRFVDYKNYMRMSEESDMLIDSYHFGGYNTVIDSLYLGKPVVTLEGYRAYNRFAPGVLKKLALTELITKSKEEYILKILKIINDDDYRLEVIKIISQINLKDKLFDNEEPKYFRKAIDFLIKNHQVLQNDNDCKPVIII